MVEQFEFQHQLVFFSAVIALVLLERVGVFQRQPVQISHRWTSNIGLFLIGNVVTALVIPVGVYAFAQHQPPGVLERLGLPTSAQFVLTFLFLDGWRYWEHRVLHKVSLLWRVHLVHHSDTQIDVTSSERHHPFEYLLSTAVLLALIWLLGLPAPAVGLYLLIAVVVVLYSHANLRLPPSVEAWLSLLIVTPGVHAVHHSELQVQTDSNYGTVLTLWDRLFGTFVHPASIQINRFGLGYFHQPKDAGLTRVLQQPFLFNSQVLRSPSEHITHQPEQTKPHMEAPIRRAMTQGWKNAILGALMGGLLAISVLWPTVLSLASAWRNNEAYQYAWLIAPLLVYVLVWHHQVGLKLNPKPDFGGVWVTAGAAVVWGMAALMNVDVGQQLALILVLQGIAMATLGWRAYWQLFPALALMFLMIPGSDLLQPVLRLLTVKIIELFVVIAGLPHAVDGFVIHIGTQRYIVVDECSGLSYVTLAMFLGYSFGLLMYRSFLKIVALSVVGALLGIFSNALRVNAIVLIDWVRGSQMELTSHGNIQWIALAMTLALLFYVLSRLQGDEVVMAPSNAPPDQSGSWRVFAPVVAGLSVLLIAGAVLVLPNNAPPPTGGWQNAGLPNKIAGWELTSPAGSWVQDSKSENETLSASYSRNGQTMHVAFVQTMSPSAKLQESLLLPADKGVWRERRVQKPSDCVASDCLTLLHTTWQRDKSVELRHVFHAYRINDFTTDSRLAIRAAHAWYRLTGGQNRPRLIGLSFDGDPPAIAEVAAAFRALQSATDDGN